MHRKKSQSEQCGPTFRNNMGPLRIFEYYGVRLSPIVKVEAFA